VATDTATSYKEPELRDESGSNTSLHSYCTFHCPRSLIQPIIIRGRDFSFSIFDFEFFNQLPTSLNTTAPDNQPTNSALQSAQGRGWGFDRA
jgi:hypothetical protein